MIYIKEKITGLGDFNMRIVIFIIWGLFFVLSDVMAVDWRKIEGNTFDYTKYTYEPITISKRNFDSINSFIESARIYNDTIIPDYIHLSLMELNQFEISKVLTKIKDTSRIKTIHFWKCNFQKLPSSIKRFSSLTTLSFNQCDSINDFCGLQECTVPKILYVEFKNCSFAELPLGLNLYPGFLKLEITFWKVAINRVFDFNKELGKFTENNNIVELHISNLTLSPFPDNIFKLSNLSFLCLHSFVCDSIPDKFNMLPNLEWVELPDIVKNNLYSLMDYRVAIVLMFKGCQSNKCYKEKYDDRKE